MTAAASTQGDSVSFAALMAAAQARLAAAGIDEPRHEARLLLAEAAELSVERIIGWPEALASQRARDRFAVMVERRCRREPMSHILGRREFWSQSFRVSADTLTPRPDSEAVIEGVLDAIADRSAPLRLLDLGTGTGCLLLTLLRELPRATGLGIDVSAAAIAIAEANAREMRLEQRAQFLRADWGDRLDDRFDVVVSNPPYIVSAELAWLAPEVSRWEPRVALDGGADGLDAYRRLAPVVNHVLAPGGIVAIEVGAGMAEAVETLFLAQDLDARGRWRDLGGRDRVVIFGNSRTTVARGHHP